MQETKNIVHAEIHNKYGGRVIAVRLLVQNTRCRNLYLFLVSAYAPVGNADQSIWEEYLRNLDNCINQKRTNDILVIGSGTNSSMVCSNDNTCLGTFGISYINESGRRFASYLAINNLIAATTCFRKKSYGTWIHPRSKNVHQIDHFLTESNTICRISDAGVTTPLLDTIIFFFFFFFFFYLFRCPTSYERAQNTRLHRWLTRAILHIASLAAHTTFSTYNLWIRSLSHQV